VEEAVALRVGVKVTAPLVVAHCEKQAAEVGTPQEGVEGEGMMTIMMTAERRSGTELRVTKRVMERERRLEQKKTTGTHGIQRVELAKFVKQIY
jgi:hypothetical protein